MDDRLEQQRTGRASPACLRGSRSEACAAYARQQVADLFGAQTTPHFFVLDQQGVLRYRGALDDVTFRQREPKNYYLHEAVQALLAGRLPEPAETPAYGCTIVRH